MNNSIIALVVDTYNKSGNKAAKKALQLLLQIHDVDTKTAKELTTSLKSYI